MKYRVEVYDLHRKMPAGLAKISNLLKSRIDQDQCSPTEAWRREFDIEPIMDRTYTGLVALDFPSEQHYLLWLLRWS
jgi:hypothetical protein